MTTPPSNGRPAPSGQLISNLIPASVWINPDGTPTPQFFQFLTALWKRTGGKSSPIDAQGNAGVTVVNNLAGSAQATAQLAEAIAIMGALSPDEPTRPPTIPNYAQGILNSEVLAIMAESDVVKPIGLPDIPAEILGLGAEADAPQPDLFARTSAFFGQADTPASQLLPSIMAMLAESDVPRPQPSPDLVAEALGLAALGDEPKSPPDFGLLVSDETPRRDTDPGLLALMAEDPVKFPLLYPQIPPSAQKVPLSCSIPGLPPANATILVVPLTIALTLGAALAGSQADALVAATSSSVFTLSYVRSGSSSVIGTVSFAAGSSVGTLSGSAYAGVVGDILTLTTPPVQDATLANVGLVFQFLKT